MPVAIVDVVMQVIQMLPRPIDLKRAFR